MNISSNNYEKSNEYTIHKKDDYSFSHNNRHFKSTSGTINQELNSENETLQILKTQNKRMLDITNELEKKEQLLKSMQQQLTTYETYKMQAENYKRQVAVLEEKLNMFKDNEQKSDFYSQQLKNVSEAENRLRNQIISKDKILYDYDKTIKENEKTISLLRKQSLEKEEIINSLKQQINEYNSKTRNITSLMESDIEEARRIREDNERRISDLLKEKQRMEEKTAELIDIIKQQSKELNEYSIQSQIAEKDKKHLIKQNQTYQSQIDELINNQCTIKEQMMSQKELKIRFNECEEKNRQLLVENEHLIKSNAMLQRNVQDTNEKYNILKNRYTGDNEPEKLKSIIDNLENEVYNLKQSNDNLSKVSKHNESITLQLEGDKKEFMKNINLELRNLITWVDNYLVNPLDRNTDIPEPSSSTSPLIKNNTYIESLKGSLLAIRKGLWNELNKNDVLIKEIRKENNNLLVKNEGLGKEVSSLKSEILTKIDEIYKLNQELQKYANEITCVQKQEYKVKNEFYDKIEHYNKFIDKIHDKLKLAMNLIYENPKLSNLCNDMTIQMSFNDNKVILKLIKQVIIENLLNRYFEIFNNLNNDHENLVKLNESYSKYKLEAEKLRKDLIEVKRNMKEENERFLKERAELSKKYDKEKVEEVVNIENSFKNNQEKMKLSLIEKDEIIQQLQMENTVLRNKLELIDKNLTNYKNTKALSESDSKEKYEKLQESYKIIDKKYTSLMREIELKDIQIKSLESLIQRREKEIEDLKRIEHSKLDQTTISKKLQINEIEKEKLVKENLSLMNMNTSLSNQFKSYKEQVHNSISSNLKMSKFEEDTVKEYEDRIKNLNVEILNKDTTINQLNIENNKLRSIQFVKDNEILSNINSNNCINISNSESMKGTIVRKKNK